jgi:hypothetical protein
MIPYLYTASRRAYDEGVAVVRPLYYEHPEAPEAYASTDQYYFGNDMIVAPISTPVDTNSQLATRHVWLPPGEWVEWCTGARIRGPVSVQRRYPLEEIPVFVRAGAIIPMQPDMMYTGERPVDPLILTVFPGDNGSVRVYEDEGNSLGYQRGECAWTPVTSQVGADATLRILIGRCEGTFKGMSPTRGYEVRCLFAWPPTSVECNGTIIPPGKLGDSTGWSYDGDRMAVVVRLPRGDATKQRELVLKGVSASRMTAIPGAMNRLHRAMGLLNNAWPREWSPEDLVLAVQTGNRITLRPASASEEAAKIVQRASSTLKTLETMEVSESTRHRAEMQIRAAVDLLK